MTTGMHRRSAASRRMATAEALRLLECCANAGRKLTMKERNQCLDALDKAGHFKRKSQ